jgi:(S)-3,5-dihydroxyphenylglycine transaminase
LVSDFDFFAGQSSEAMNFLNEVVTAYPRAISFGPGRPLESLFDVRAALAHVEQYAAGVRGDLSLEHVLGRLGQYGATNGAIREEVAQYLRTDEGLDVAAHETLVTVGCQEAMLLLLVALFDPARDVLLVADPAYVGMTGAASMLRVPMWPVPHGVDGLRPEDVAEAARAVRAHGRIPRALYHVPTFNNPLGSVMPLAARHQLLEIASEHDLLIFEDNAYGAFAYDADPPPSLASLDREGRVIYLGSFSKSLFPGLRVGYLAAHRCSDSLIGTLSRVKSYTTVNTSPLLQAVVGGILRQHDCSLKTILAPKRAQYRKQRDQMLASLTETMSGADVRWNRPSGGFFLSLSLPFAFDEQCLKVCAESYGVICTPMRYFTAGTRWDNFVRLSFSYASPQQIDQGIRALSAFVADRDRR